LASDFIDRKYQHLSPDVSLSEKLEREDLIDRKLKNISEATARRNLFTLPKFDIKGFVNPESIKRNALERPIMRLKIISSREIPKPTGQLDPLLSGILTLDVL
jgi:hypothetical protein